MRIADRDGQVQSYMANVKFDMNDPETKATVGSWADGETYPITMVSSAAGTGTYEEVEEEAAPPAEGAGAPGPAAVKAAMAAPV